MAPIRNPVLQLIPATFSDYRTLAAMLRDDDVAECRAMGWSPQDALWYALATYPTSCFAVGSMVRGGDEPTIVGAFGGNTDTIWSLWADVSFKEAKVMLKWSNWAIAKVLDTVRADSLTNMVSLRNAGALAWMARCPAITIDRTKEVRYGGIPFAPFVARKLPAPRG